MSAQWSTLIAEREAAGVSRYRLAKLMRINLSHLGRLERGEVSPRVGTVRRAAEALEVDVARVAPAGSALTDDVLLVSMERVKETVREVVAEEFRKRNL